MKIHILQVPYDSGNRSVRMGAGPEHLIRNGLSDLLQASGHDITVEMVESQTEFRAEVKTQFELYKALATRVAEIRQNRKFPLILSGNCGATLGAIAGTETEQLGVIWFDAHGEFNTPETTTSGFLDGMGLSIATGQCWKKLAASIPNFRPISGANILLAGGRDFDEGERERLEQAGVAVVDAAAFELTSVQEALQPTLSTFRQGLEEVHLHVDLDVLNPKEAPANGFMAGEGGLRVEQLSEAIAFIKQNLKITSATVASFDPSYDPQGKTLRTALKLIQQIVE